VEPQQAQALLRALGINLLVLPPLCCRPLAVHGTLKMLPAIHLSCYLPQWEPQIKWFLVVAQHPSLQHHWA
jgi:hypothetical protein